MGNISQMSMLEVAVSLMEDKRNPQPIKKIIEETLQMKGLDDPNGELTTQLYIDITTSSKFVYMGDELWDLKSRQSLDEWDKDGSAFNTLIEDEDDDDITVDDYQVLDDEDSNDDEDYDYNDDIIDSDNEDIEESEEDEFDSIRDNPDEDDDFDEDDYDNIMDDYEDLYDKK